MVGGEAFAGADESADLGDVHAGLGGEVIGDGGEGGGVLLGEGAADSALAGVVSGERQPPILETVVEIFQVLGGGRRAGFRLQTLVARPERKPGVVSLPRT